MKKVLVGISIGLVAGCGHMAPRIEESYLVGIPAADIAGFVVAADGVALKYRKRFLKQEDREWDTGEANLIGGTVGAIGAVAHSIPAAGVGAVTVGAAGMVSNFYGVEKQNDAFSKAFIATRCLSTVASNINKPSLLSNYLSPDAQMTAESYALQKLNAGMVRIEDKLVERLRKRAVSTAPDFSAFEQAIRARITAADLPKSKPGFTADEAGKELEAAVARLEADINICISAN